MIMYLLAPTSILSSIIVTNENASLPLGASQSALRLESGDCIMSGSSSTRDLAVLEARLQATYFQLQKNFYESKLRYVLHPLARSLDRLDKHRTIIDMASSAKQRKDWLSAVTMVQMLFHVSNGSDVAEAQKAEQLIECLPENTVRSDARSFDPSLKFRFPEQNPDTLIRSAEEKINHFVRLMQELNRLADEALWCATRSSLKSLPSLSSL